MYKHSVNACLPSLSTFWPAWKARVNHSRDKDKKACRWGICFPQSNLLLSLPPHDLKQCAGHQLFGFLFWWEQQLAIVTMNIVIFQQWSWWWWCFCQCVGVLLRRYRMKECFHTRVQLLPFGTLSLLLLCIFCWRVRDGLVCGTWRSQYCRKGK